MDYTATVGAGLDGGTSHCLLDAGARLPTCIAIVRKWIGSMKLASKHERQGMPSGRRQGSINRGPGSCWQKRLPRWSDPAPLHYRETGGNDCSSYSCSQQYHSAMSMSGQETEACMVLQRLKTTVTSSGKGFWLPWPGFHGCIPENKGPAETKSSGSGTQSACHGKVVGKDCKTH